MERFQVAPFYNTTNIIYKEASIKRNAYHYHKWRANPEDLVTYFLARDLRETGLFNGKFILSSKRYPSIADKAKINRGAIMLNLEVKTKLTPEKVVEKLKRYFGEGGLGLKLRDDTSQCLNFEGTGGYVTATLCPEDPLTRVELVTQEWEYHVKQFAAQLK